MHELKTCTACGVGKHLSDFGMKGRGDKLREICKPCDAGKRKARQERYNLGKVITATPTKNNLMHPELDRIRDERKAAYSQLDEADERARDGFVYIIEVPGQRWLKIGHARDPYQRVKGVKSFLTEDPKVRHMVYTDDRMRDEKVVHEALETYRHSSGKELFDCGYELAKEVLDDNVGSRHRSQRPDAGGGHYIPSDDSGGGLQWNLGL